MTGRGGGYDGKGMCGIMSIWRNKAGCLRVFIKHVTSPPLSFPTFVIGNPGSDETGARLVDVLFPTPLLSFPTFVIGNPWSFLAGCFLHGPSDTMALATRRLCSPCPKGYDSRLTPGARLF